MRSFASLTRRIFSGITVKLPKDWLTYGIYFLLILCLSEAIILLVFRMSNNNQNEPEIKAIKNTRDIIKQVGLYKQLIERVGPIKAQDDLFTSGLPFDGEAHLLNHTVGEWLYKKYKTAGLIYCKDYFLSSCYHGFVIDAIADGGIATMSSIMDACWKAPIGVAYQCAHAIGHGLLAFDGYKNLTQALADCDRVSTESKNFPDYYCYDGVFMENVYGVHNGGPSPYRWINKDDPVFPCDDPRIGEKYMEACWTEQPQAMYKLFRGNYTHVGQECLTLTNKKYQSTCFDSIARQMTPDSHGNIDSIFRLCDFMPKNWIAQCAITSAKSYLSQGDSILPFRVCGKLQEQQTDCYIKLAYQIQYTTQKDTQERKNLCGKITDVTIQKQCLAS